MENTDVETEFLDVLQNLEAAIIRVDSESDDLTDLEVIDALDYLIRAFTAEGNGRSAPFVRLSPLKRQVVDTVKAIAEWRMGRTSEAIPAEALSAAEPEELTASSSEGLAVPDSDVLSLSGIAPAPVTLDDIIACLRRIRRSAKYWNGNNGRRGYLEYVSNFIR